MFSYDSVDLVKAFTRSDFMPATHLSGWMAVTITAIITVVLRNERLLFVVMT